MRRWLSFSSSLAIGLGLVVSSGTRQTSRRVDDDAEIERGRYLVHDVAMCVQCHSPRDDDGNLEPQRLLQGGRIPVESPYRNIVWGFEAPPLAGLPGWEPEQVVTLLMTGHRPNGRSPRPPMPPFRLSEDDARAIVAYLSSRK